MRLLDRLFRRTTRPQHVRRFDAAGGGRRGWGMGNFGRINSEVAAAGASLRGRARYLANNNPFIANAVANWTGALVGPGIMPTSQHPDASARKVLAKLFNGWAEDADADGRTTFWGLQADVARGLVIDGEAFVQFVGIDGVRLRLIPPELIDESMTREIGDGGVIIQGIEFDADGRRLAYHVLPHRPHGQFSTYAPPVRIDASEILHIMKPLAAGQVRGIS